MVSDLASLGCESGVVTFLPRARGSRSLLRAVRRK
jgi:hypothetical protein